MNPNENFCGPKDIAEIGLPAFWYPGGIKDAKTIPRMAYIAASWSKGAVDLAILPSQPGAIEYLTGVYHISDPRTRTPGSTAPSSAAIYKGMWEFAPMAVQYMKCQTCCQNCECQKPSDTVTPAPVKKTK